MLQASQQVIQQTLAQRAVGDAQRPDAQRNHQLGQDRETAGPDLCPPLRQAGHRQAADVVEGEHPLDQCLDRLERHLAGFLQAGQSRDALGRQDRAGRADGLDISAAAEERLDRSQFEFCRCPRPVESLARDGSVGEKTFGHRHATQVQALERARLGAAAEDDFGAAAADVEHQPHAVVWRQAVRHTLVDQPGFLDARDNLDRVAECRFGFGHESEILARASDRAGTSRAYVGRAHRTQTLAKLGQAGNRPLPGSRRQRAVVRQTLGQAHGFPEAIDDRELAMAQLADDHVKTVGSEVDGRNDLRLVCCRFRR